LTIGFEIIKTAYAETQLFSYYKFSFSISNMYACFV